jgi:hypothetical protein
MSRPSSNIVSWIRSLDIFVSGLGKNNLVCLYSREAIQNTAQVSCRASFSAILAWACENGRNGSGPEGSIAAYRLAMWSARSFLSVIVSLDPLDTDFFALFP